MNLKRFTIFGVVLLAVAAAVQLFLSSGPAQTSATGELDSGTIERRAPEKVDGEEEVHPGYNPIFDDTPRVQTAWIGRASDIIDINLPEGAESAEVRQEFFHRGFKGKAAICLKVSASVSMPDTFLQLPVCTSQWSAYPGPLA